MSQKVIINAKSLVQHGRENTAYLKGKEMAQLPMLDNAWVRCRGGRIHSYGTMDIYIPEPEEEVIDAQGCYVLPAFCDPHTHLVFAAWREGEFLDRIKGLTYEEIAAKGGGILNSARKLADSPEEELYEFAMQRIEEVKSFGTGAIEIKSGYGLSLESELKMLRVIHRIKDTAGIPVKANFLGAHAYPAEFKQDHEGYLDILINQMLPQIAEEGLADFIDCFCERNYFSKEEMDRILTAGAQYGLRPKVHVNQFSVQGGIEVAVKHDALSVDHLEVVDDKDIEALQGSSTMPTLLPSCSFFLNIDYAPARKLIDAGLPVALGSDYNPGSTPTGNIPFLISLACIKYRMTTEEAINATTMNAAYAMGLEEDMGSIDIGKRANLIITEPMPSLDWMGYAFGSKRIGRLVMG